MAPLALAHMQQRHSDDQLPVTYDILPCAKIFPVSLSAQYVPRGAPELITQKPYATPRPALYKIEYNIEVAARKLIFVLCFTRGQVWHAGCIQKLILL